MSVLFEKIKVGDLELPNRIIMAPLTRARAGSSRVPNQLMADYYTQRASAGLIISEATSICPMGVGYADTPGIWSEEQIAGWKLVTKAVHDKGGRIFLQLWHVGRISDPMFLNGEMPVAPSAIAPRGHVSLVRPEKPFVVPRELTVDQISEIVESYRQGAINAKVAGFDGVEIHGANGYLLDQFLHDGSNTRTDIYGGSVENRARLMLEVTDAVISVWGSGRVGMHLSPRCDYHDVSDSNRLETFSYVVQQLKQRKIAFICARELQGDNYIGDKLKKEFGGVYIANQGLTKETAEKLIIEGNADAVAFGVLFIANSDLVDRLLVNASLNKPDPRTFYVGGATGYIDYPVLSNG